MGIVFAYVRTRIIAAQHSIEREIKTLSSQLQTGSTIDSATLSFSPSVAFRVMSRDSHSHLTRSRLTAPLHDWQNLIISSSPHVPKSAMHVCLHIYYPHLLWSDPLKLFPHASTVLVLSFACIYFQSSRSSLYGKERKNPTLVHRWLC